MTIDLKGIITPVVTVLNDDESIDIQGFCDHIHYLMDHGAYGVFVGGSQGEGYGLTLDEKLLLIDEARETVDGRIPVIAGTGAPTTRETIAATQAAHDHGADAAAIITPYFIHPDQDELYRHYCDILDAVDIPILVYNNPWFAHLNILPETVARLCEYSPNTVGIKDSSGDLAMTLRFKEYCPDSFRVLLGQDQLIYSALASGIDGAMAASANAAVDIVLGIYNEYMAGNHETAREYQRKLTPLSMFISAGRFPVATKEAMMLQGLPAGPCRRPLGSLSEQDRTELGNILKDMGLLA